eukprot:SAG31_NODE_2934_length_4895_cov_688.829195_2_plen_89_part_00
MKMIVNLEQQLHAAVDAQQTAETACETFRSEAAEKVATLSEEHTVIKTRCEVLQRELDSAQSALSAERVVARQLSAKMRTSSYANCPI